MFMYDVFLINNLQGKEQLVNSYKDQLVHRPTRIQKTYKHRVVKLYMDVLYEFVPRFLDTQRNQIRHILCTSFAVNNMIKIFVSHSTKKIGTQTSPLCSHLRQLIQ